MVPATTPAIRSTDELAQRLQARGLATGPAHFSAAQREELGGAAPSLAVRPKSVEELRAALEEARLATVGVLARGGGTALALGFPPRAGLLLEMAGLDRIVEHAVSDFVVTVEAGLRLADLQRELALQRQWLAFEPPAPEQATIGGLIASGATSLVAAQHGTLRNHLLGLEVVYADGRRAKAGGRVVKNVAGYDLMKMHHGALGTLGIVVGATLRLRPLPAADLVAAARTEQPATVVDFAGALGEPGFVPAGVHFAGNVRAHSLEGDLLVRFQGARGTVMEQADDVERRLGPSLSWRRDSLEPGQRNPRPAPLLALEEISARGDGTGTLHLSLHFRPSRLQELLAALGNFGAGRLALDLVRGTGFLKLVTEGETLGLVQELVTGLERLQSDLTAAGATLHLHAGPAAFRTRLAPFEPQTTRSPDEVPVARLWKALKQELDPDELFAPGRLGPLA